MTTTLIIIGLIWGIGFLFSLGMYHENQENNTVTDHPQWIAWILILLFWPHYLGYAWSKAHGEDFGFNFIFALIDAQKKPGQFGLVFNPLLIMSTLHRVHDNL